MEHVLFRSLMAASLLHHCLVRRPDLFLTLAATLAFSFDFRADHARQLLFL
jgi:hypothetical protein